MKLKKYNKFLFLVLKLGLMSSITIAQNQSCNKIEINSINLKSSTIDIVYGYPIISDNKEVKFELDFDFNEGKGTSDSIKIDIAFNGYNISDELKQLFKTGLTVAYSDITKKGKEIQLIAKNVVKYKAGNIFKASPDNPIVITSVVVSISSLCNGKPEEVKRVCTCFRLKDGSVTSVLASDDYFIDKPKVNYTFLNETKTEKYTEYVIGFNDKVNDELNLIEKYSTKGKKGKTANAWCTEEVKSINSSKLINNEITPIKDKNGKWTFIYKSTITDSKNPPVLVNFEIEIITLRNDSIKYRGIYKEKLADKKPWDYKVKMGNVNAIDNPTFEPANGGMTNIMALTFPSSSVTISGGDFIISNTSKLTVGIVNNMAISNGIDTKKVTDANIDIQYSVAGDGRVFWHWSFPVTTTNPKGVIDIDTNKFNPIKIESAEIRFITDEKDTIIYETNGKYASSMDGKTMYLLLEKTGKKNYIDPCKTKYVLKDIEYTETTVSGLYALQFSFKFEAKSDVPNNVAMIVELKDCKGNKQYIKITLKFDSKSGTYVGSQSITQSKECAWELSYGEIAAYNACKDKTVWSFDAKESKNNGKGTRVVATTTNGTPGLL